MVEQKERHVIKPPRLSAGDEIGIIAPATPFTPAVPSAYQEQFGRGVALLESLGLHVQISTSVKNRDKHAYVSPESRAQEINGFFAKPAIKAIISLVGGRSANALLPHLDWQSIASKPKVILGYSAVTALLVGMYARTGLVTFHGPMLLNGFGEFPTMFEYSSRQLEDVAFDATAPGPRHPPEEWTTDYPREDRARKVSPQKGWHWLRSGRARGRLIGGNLATLCTLAGTPFLPSFKDSILFLEEVKTGPSILQEVDESLAHLAMLGVFADIRGLVVGKLNDATEFETDMFDRLISHHTVAFDFPILSQVDLGHTDPKLTLPIGIHATLDSGARQFSFDEAAVRV
jgi:muramoyltetrapeptide carboxypeptidase LdcA involved in peptidoglycan recycling